MKATKALKEARMIVEVLTNLLSASTRLEIRFKVSSLVPLDDIAAWKISWADVRSNSLATSMIGLALTAIISFNRSSSH